MIVSYMVRMAWQDIPVANVLWFDQSNTGEGGLQDVADQIGAAYVSELGPQISDELALIDCLVRVFNGGAPFSQVVQPAAFPAVGAQDNQDVPRNVALLLSTSHNGPRPNRGRVYIPGMTEAQWDGDGWTSAAVAAAVAFGDALMAVSDATWVVARPNYDANTAVGHAVDATVVRTLPGSQRGRRTG